MARPQSFIETDVVHRAMELFWTKGFEATSMADLTEHLGVHPGSLYRTFGDKQGLFLRALDCYRDTQTRMLAPLLLEDGPVMPRIRSVLLDYLRLASEQDQPRGCLAANTSGERLPADPTVREAVAEIMAIVEDGFLQGLRHAERRGEIPRGMDLPAHAAMLTMLLQGLQTVVKSDPDPLRLAVAVDAALAVFALPHAPTAAEPR